MHSDQLIHGVQHLVAILGTQKIPWCVLRNHEGFPRPLSDTSDHDILVGASYDTCVELLRQVANQATTVRLGKIITRDGGDLLTFYLSQENSPSLRVDLIRNLAWHGIPILSTETVLASRNTTNRFPIPAPGQEAAVSLFSYLFHQGVVKPAYRERIQALIRADQQGFVACLAPIWGEALAGQLAAHAIDGDWGWFEVWVMQARRKLKRQTFVHLPFLAAQWRILVNNVRRFLAPPGLWVAFMGPDGAGKTTVAEAYRARLATLFYPHQQRQFHWRPTWLPAPGKLAGHSPDPATVTDPHLKPVYGRLLSLARFFYFLLDFELGHWIRVRPLIAKAGLVTFDRYYQDFMVDPRRYRLNLPSWLIRWAGFLIPQPELIFVLDAPAEVLYSRKQELPLSEIAAQLDALRRATAGNPVTRLVSVDRSVKAIVDVLEHETLACLNERNRRRLGWDNN